MSATLPPARIGPLTIERLTQDEALARIDAAVAGGPALRLAFCNAHTMLLAFDRPDYAAALGRLTLLNDGIGADLAARALAGARFPANLNGTDLVPALLAASPRPLRLFLLGARPTMVTEAASRLAARFPRHAIVGWRDGYFDDAAAVLAEIAASRADVLLVAMGNPRQEQFLAQHDRAIAAPVALGVGGLFDFLAGAVPRAPRPVRALRLEWLFRLAVEPRRLGQRYTIGVLRFLWAVARLRAGGAATAAPR